MDGTSSTQQLEMLLKERLDAVLISSGKIGLDYIISTSNLPTLKENYSQFEIQQKTFDIDPNYIAFTKISNNKELLNEFDKHTKKARSLGKIK